MKSVLISIQPKWVEKIASGEKTIEVRKNRPKLETLFKVYIYQSKKFVQAEIGEANKYRPFLRQNQGKVIGEFICDKVEEYLCEKYDWGEGDVSLEYRIRSVEGRKTCLEYGEIREYGKEKPLYFWHISDLKIYDKPKELSEFFHACKQPKGTDCSQCIDRREKTCYSIKRPPQSWCYVED